MAEDRQVVRQIVKIFWDADKDKTGSISMRELHEMLQKNGFEMTFEQFQVREITIPNLIGRKIVSV